MSLEGLHLTRVRCHWRVYGASTTHTKSAFLNRNCIKRCKLSGADHFTGRDTTYFGSTVGRCAVARARAPSRRACSGLHGSVAPPYRSPHPDPRRNRSSSGGAERWVLRWVLGYRPGPRGRVDSRLLSVKSRHVPAPSPTRPQLRFGLPSIKGPGWSGAPVAKA